MIEKIPEDFVKLINFLNEIVSEEEATVRSLDEEIEIVKIEDILKYLPEILFFRHGFGIIRLNDELYIVETNIYIDDIFKAPKGSVLTLSRLCMKTLYDTYRFYYKINRFEKRLSQYYDKKYVNNIHSDLKYVLRKTKIPQGIFCEESSHV